ncbi:MAG: complex I NDUFA9 subunit family protein [Gammaproteobacteria bacterium]|nr:complex I NDUFA9 subunit family protein [Gammaproteobacteria bacterium]
MRQHRVCIVGGTGFVGHAIAAKLAAAGHQVRILSRQPQRHKDLLVLPTAHLRACNPYDVNSLVFSLKGYDVVINLVGILNEPGRSGKGYELSHVRLTEAVVAACQRVGVSRYLHMSALHADEAAPSHYLRSKARAEKIALAAHSRSLRVTVFRPSVIFGPQDSFINRFASLLKMSPALFPLAGAWAKFQPVYVGDVAQAFVNAMDNPSAYGKAFELCGPRAYSLEQLLRYIADELGYRTRIIPLGRLLSRMQAELFEWMPPPFNRYKPFSVDNYRSLTVDSVCNSGFPEVLGIKPVSLEAMAPTWLGKTVCDLYSCYRVEAGR